jgi:hypothetical protein
LDGLTTSWNCSKKSFSQTAKGMLGSVSAGLGKSGEPPALNAKLTTRRALLRQPPKSLAQEVVKR